LSRRWFLVLLVLITLKLWTLAALAARGEAPGGLRGVLVCIQAGFGANAIAPHVYLLLRLRRYTPEVATAGLLNLLFSLYLLFRALDAGYTNLLFGAETNRSAPEHDSNHPFQQATASDDTDEFAFTGGFYW
jgi:Protein of unknown function with HXXEE motif